MSRFRAASVHQVLPRPAHVIAVVVLLLIVLAPLAYILSASVNSDLAVAAGDFWPSQFTFDNYARIWQTADLAGGLRNSVLISGSVAVVSALVSVMTAYVLVRYKFLGRLTTLRGLVVLQSVPGTLLLLPIFVLFASVSTALRVPIIGTPWAVFVTYLTFALPFATWVMVTYLRGLPLEIEEAARIDGAGPATVLLRIVLPLSWPGIVVAAIFSFLQGWNDVLFSSVMTSPASRTAAVALSVLSSTQDTGAVPIYGQMMAASLVCAAPVVLLNLVFQRYLVNGLTAGGIK
ncbi:carbohydrate ABC transporter permease [Kutzneria sp. NPDC052558]|uniref:carbohydrate ABC transporter permease n=1 Tax=Kutzneria sp. NPDC052558 TaxID=3364121 RepID=UPI0037C5C0E2